MKRPILSILLMAVWPLSGCLEATPIGAPVGRQEASSEAPAVDDGPSSGDSFNPLAAAAPIEPKSDQKEIDTIIAPASARLRYGKDFSEILPRTPAESYPIFGPVQVTLRFTMDVNGQGNIFIPDWHPLTDKSQVRMVFSPKGKPASDATYCDGVWEVLNDGTYVLSFPNVVIGEGEMRFFLYYLCFFDMDHNVLTGVTDDFHAGDLIPLVTGDPAHPFVAPEGVGTVFDLGSFKINVVKLVPAELPIMKKQPLP